MANLIVINDIIGLGESSVDAIREQLKKFEGQPVKAEINSPGGFVFEGLEIFHMFKNHTGFVHMHVMSMAASMASVIPLAGNKITAEESTVWMIHNVFGGAFGDFRDLQKEADLLKNLRDLLANIFAKKTKQSSIKIKNLMDEETFFFGDESLNFGLVDEIIKLPENKKETKNDAIEYAKIAMLECEMKMKKSGKKENSEKAAAMLKSESENISENIIKVKCDSCKNEMDFNTKGLPYKGLKHICDNCEMDSILSNNNKPAESGKEEVSKTMITLETLKNENPDLYNTVINIGKEAGVKQERERVTSHIQWLEVAPEASMKAIMEGEDFTNTHLSMYSKASLNKQTVGNAIEENPDDVSTETTLDDKDAKEAELLNQTMILSKNSGGK
jgi:ATP-dependent Clp endopeptidase proteolytic subunit ClpP